MGRGIHRGFITHEELNKSWEKRYQMKIWHKLFYILDESIVLVKKKL